MEILFQSYTAYSRYIERYDSLTSEEALAVVQSHPPSPPPPATPPHLPREKKMRLRERECCTSIEAWEDGDKRYPGNEVDLEHNDYDVMCLDKMQHEKLLFYISLSFCFWVRSRFCFVFLVWDFVFPFRDYLSVLGFAFSILLVCFFFLGFCTSVLYYGNKSDRNGAYERRVIKVLTNVWNCIFTSSQWVGQFYVPWQFIPFCTCPCVGGILVVTPNGCRQCMRVRKGASWVRMASGL